MGLVTKLLAWWDSPVSGDNNPKDWLYFLGLVIVASVLWKLVLDRIGV